MDSIALAAPFLALMASPVLADNQRVWPGTMYSGGESYVHIGEPTAPHAIATVTFKNAQVHSGDDTFNISHDDITVTVHLGFNVDADGSETVTVDAQDGYVAVPRSITVGEFKSDVIHIVKWDGS